MGEKDKDRIFSNKCDDTSKQNAYCCCENNY